MDSLQNFKIEDILVRNNRDQHNRWLLKHSSEIIPTLRRTQSQRNNWGFEIEGVDGAGECGQLDPEVLAYKLAPCAAAAQDKNVEVPPNCCALMQKVRTSCLCAIILSKEAKSLGITPVVAVTIPKRCKIAGRPRGYKCGGILCGASMMRRREEDHLAMARGSYGSQRY
ncbi:Haloacid dehalogenase-like hydrolase superfamily protein [Prunus dulcis]|uniref:Haloacid dehalogenase-like hydrolase superfamily protein n=1 Tax=Prunus dulcis TaxID=3755 RepID=A0A4Y1R1U1_PRUDU|nr:Haloacid dehalogenase-like hydrolase superfamily protein [Prunus dulcis]